VPLRLVQQLDRDADALERHLALPAGTACPPPPVDAAADAGAATDGIDKHAKPSPSVAAKQESRGCPMSLPALALLARAQGPTRGLS
jgi:hypothetical protein